MNRRLFVTKTGTLPIGVMALVLNAGSCVAQSPRAAAPGDQAGALMATPTPPPAPAVKAPPPGSAAAEARIRADYALRDRGSLKDGLAVERAQTAPDFKMITQDGRTPTRAQWFTVTSGEEPVLGLKPEVQIAITSFLWHGRLAVVEYHYYRKTPLRLGGKTREFSAKAVWRDVWGLVDNHWLMHSTTNISASEWIDGPKLPEVK